MKKEAWNKAQISIGNNIQTFWKHYFQPLYSSAKINTRFCTSYSFIYHANEVVSYLKFVCVCKKSLTFLIEVWECKGRVHSKFLYNVSSASSYGKSTPSTFLYLLKYRISSVSKTSFTSLKYVSSKAPSCA